MVRSDGGWGQHRNTVTLAPRHFDPLVSVRSVFARCCLSYLSWFHDVAAVVFPTFPALKDEAWKRISVSAVIFSCADVTSTAWGHYWECYRFCHKDMNRTLSLTPPPPPCVDATSHRLLKSVIAAELEEQTWNLLRDLIGDGFTLPLWMRAAWAFAFLFI